MINGTDVSLPEFDLEIYEMAIEFGSSEEDALEVAIAATDDFEPLDREIGRASCRERVSSPV